MLVSVGRRLYRIAAVLLRAYHQVVPGRVRGVRCVLRDGNEVLLVRHTYGSERWMLPGGLVRRRERPLAAMRRELDEELSMSASAWRYLGHNVTRNGLTRTVTFFFAARALRREVREQAVEIDAAQWFPSDDLPPNCAAETRRAVASARRRA